LAATEAILFNNSQQDDGMTNLSRVQQDLKWKNEWITRRTLELNTTIASIKEKKANNIAWLKVGNVIILVVD
jgi:hypothetical protein